MNEQRDEGLDAAIAAMLRRREITGAPPGMEATIAARIRSTRQAGGFLARLAGRTRPSGRSAQAYPSAVTWNGRSSLAVMLLAAAVLLASMASLAVFLASRPDHPKPLGEAPGLLAYSVIDTFYTYDPLTSQRTEVTLPYLDAIGWSWSEDGRHILLGDGSWISPDGSGRTAAPSPSPVPSGSNGSWSPDGSRYAGVVGDRIVIISGNGIERSLALPDSVDRVIGKVSWSADGRWLAISACHGDACPASGPASAWSLWLVAVDGSSSRQVATAANAIADPAWSPDATAVAYWSGPCSLEWALGQRSDGCDGAGAFVVGTAGGAPRMISPTGTSGAWPIWNQDSRVQVLLRQPGESTWHPFLVDPDGGNLAPASPVPPPPDPSKQPIRSADGSVVAFTRAVRTHSWGYREDLWVSLPNGGEARLVAEGISAFAFQPAVSTR